ncbi:Uncharacterised protein [Mycobacteroides abscessus subsp. abscessus]|nr:Uncharacterised protein [Mycobacteroides abscessus subsp. abscessus]
MVECSTRCTTAATVSWSRSSRFSSIAWLILIRACRVSGTDSCNRSKVCSDQFTKPSGGFLRTSLRSFLGSSPILAMARSFSMTCSGAWATT